MPGPGAEASPLSPWYLCELHARVIFIGIEAGEVWLHHGFLTLAAAVVRASQSCWTAMRMVQPMSGPTGGHGREGGRGSARS